MLEREVHVRHGLRLGALCRVDEHWQAVRLRDTAWETLPPKQSSLPPKRETPGHLV